MAESRVNPKGCAQEVRNNFGDLSLTLASMTIPLGASVNLNPEELMEVAMVGVAFLMTLISSTGKVSARLAIVRM